MDIKTEYIVGIDEVGRGPIAGPVAVCSFCCREDFTASSISDKLPKLKDSKKLTKKQREEWFKYLKTAKDSGHCNFYVSYVSAENIDKFGISKCIKKALDSSLKKLNLDPNKVFIFLDGGLKAEEEYVYQETIIRGDETNPVISLASIIAKVSRDRIMQNYGKEYSGYGFEGHSGYGTKAHYEAIKKNGTTPIHRKTFIH